MLALGGCAKLGPDYQRPAVAVAPNWSLAADPRLAAQADPSKLWWRVFKDPVLDRLVEAAYRQNLPLQVAGVRVLEARAQLGVAIGGFYPQTQQALGSLQYNQLSLRFFSLTFDSGFSTVTILNDCPENGVHYNSAGSPPGSPPRWRSIISASG
ncbi:hypothetical protein [Methylomagnum ishizawai]|nr:hypothetical protein [Methylomagnum ishizawai]